MQSESGVQFFKRIQKAGIEQKVPLAIRPTANAISSTPCSSKKFGADSVDRLLRTCAFEIDELRTCSPGRTSASGGFSQPAFVAKQLKSKGITNWDCPFCRRQFEVKKGQSLKIVKHIRERHPVEYQQSGIRGLLDPISYVSTPVADHSKSAFMCPHCLKGHLQRVPQETSRQSGLEAPCHGLLQVRACRLSQEFALCQQEHVLHQKVPRIGARQRSRCNLFGAQEWCFEKKGQEASHLPQVSCSQWRAQWWSW